MAVGEAITTRLINETGTAPLKRIATKGWCAFWATAFLSFLTSDMPMLMFPDIAVAYFNGGLDPCLGPGGKESQLCTSTLQKVTSITTVFRTVSAILTFVCSPFVGLAADYFGRKPLLVMCLVIKLLQVCALGAVAVGKASIYCFYACNELVGLMPIQVVGQLYIADRTEPFERTQLFARIGAVSALTGVVAPSAIVVLPPEVRLVAVLVLAIITLALGVCFIEESRPLQGQQTDPRDMDQTICARFAVLIKLMKLPVLRSISVLYLAGQIAAAGLGGVLQYYYKEKFGMDIKSMAPIMLTLNVSLILGNLFLVKPLIHHFGLKGLITISYSMGALFCFGNALAFSIRFSLACAVIGGASNLHVSAVQTVFTNAVSSLGNEIGVTLGAITSLYSVAAILGPLLFTACFDVFQPFSGSPFLLGLLMYIVGVVLWVQIPASAFPDLGIKQAPF